MPIIDFHNHFYPPAYLDAIKQGPSNVGYSEDENGNPVLHYPGDYNVVVPGHRDIAYRQQVLDDAGIDRQVLTFTSPGTHIEEPERAASLARMVNDAFAEIVAARGSHFTALATLPLNDPAASLAEFERATGELGFAGCMLFSNAGGVALADQRYWPIYERASDRRAVLYIHPIDPVGVEAMTQYWLMPLPRTWCLPASPSASRTSSGCSAISAARCPTFPSASTAASRPSRTAGRTSTDPRAST
jgi:predicted TIM-barrel fold metal-dependent hydrolase